MTTKNGLPCNFVTSFIEDREKRWWLYTDCGIVELPDSELKRWWTNPEVIVQTRVSTNRMEPGPDDRFTIRRHTLRMGAFGLRRETSYRWWTRPGSRRRRSPAMTYVQSLTVDRKEFAATDNLKLPPHPRDVAD